MNSSNNKRSYIVYAILILMLIGLLVFSLFPIFNGALQASNQPSQIRVDRQAELEDKARGYELVLAREPNNQAALRGLLEIRLQQKDLQRAVSPLETLAQLNSDVSAYTILLAQTKQQLGDYEGAKQAYQSILDDNPGDLQALQGMINLLIPQQETETAIDLIQKTLQTNQLTGDNLLGVQLLLGQVYALSDRYTEAIAVYDQMIEANSDDFRPVLAKAIVLKNQGKIEESTELFTQAISLAPSQYQEQIQSIASVKNNRE